MRSKVIKLPEDALQITQLPNTKESILRETVEDLRVSRDLQTDGHFVVEGVEPYFY